MLGVCDADHQSWSLLWRQHEILKGYKKANPLMHVLKGKCTAHPSISSNGVIYLTLTVWWSIFIIMMHMYTVSEWLLCVGGATLLLHCLISKLRVSKSCLCLPKRKIGIACDFWRWLQLPWFPFWTVDEKQEAARGQAVFRNLHISRVSPWNTWCHSWKHKPNPKSAGYAFDDIHSSSFNFPVINIFLVVVTKL